jgi:hypothetical protein
MGFPKVCKSAPQFKGQLQMKIFGVYIKSEVTEFTVLLEKLNKICVL